MHDDESSIQRFGAGPGTATGGAVFINNNHIKVIFHLLQKKCKKY
jgi:hypothetical protein